jgi:hypothetical protein
MNEFTNEIDLGKSPEKTSPEAPKKDSRYFPTIYLDGVDLSSAPKSGQALITYKIKRVTISTGEANEDTSADLEILKIAFPGGAVEEEDEDLGGALKKLAKEKGITDDGDGDLADDIEDEDEEDE